MRIEEDLKPTQTSTVRIRSGSPAGSRPCVLAEVDPARTSSARSSSRSPISASWSSMGGEGTHRGERLRGGHCWRGVLGRRRWRGEAAAGLQMRLRCCAHALCFHPSPPCSGRGLFCASTPLRPAHQGALTMKLLGKNVRLLGGLGVMDRGLL
jgi:hypothetical protein